MNNLLGIVSIIFSAISATLYKISIKQHKINIFFQSTIFCFALLLVSLITTLYYNYTTKYPFKFSELFLNSERVTVGLFYTGFILFIFTAYKIVPFSLAMPLIYTFPLFYVIFAYLINKQNILPKEPSKYIPTIIGGILIIISIIYIIINNINNLTNSNIFGLGLIILGVLCLSLYLVFVKNISTRVVYNKDTKKIYQENKNRSSYNIASIQLLEANTIPFIILLIISIIIYTLPKSTEKYLKTLHIPSVLLEKNFGKSYYTIPILFIIFLILGFAKDILQIIAVNNLQPQVFSALSYTNVLLCTIAGIFIFKEKIDVSKIIGILGIILGACIIIYVYEYKDTTKCLNKCIYDTVKNI